MTPTTMMDEIPSDRSSTVLTVTPEVEEDSRIGAIDSMVAGITASLTRGESVGSAARLGVAAGTAAVMTPATELCRRKDVESILDAVGLT